MAITVGMDAYTLKLQRQHVQQAYPLAGLLREDRRGWGGGGGAQ